MGEERELERPVQTGYATAPTLVASGELVHPYRSWRSLPRLSLLLCTLLLLASLPLSWLLVSAGSVHIPPLTAIPGPGGTLAFTSSMLFDQANTQGTNDGIFLQIDDLPPLRRERGYHAWLLADPGDRQTPPLWLGALSPQRGQATLTYTSPTHANLLASYSGVCITEQQQEAIPTRPGQKTQSTLVEGWLPHTSTPGDEQGYSFLSHLRHLLASDPTLQANGLAGGLLIWLTRNSSKIAEWAGAAQGQWHGQETSAADADLIHRHMERILEYLDGVHYASLDLPTGSAWIVDRRASTFGLLNRVQNQEPPGLLEHVQLHVEGLIASPGHTVSQQQLAVRVRRVIERMRQDEEQILRDATMLVRLHANQLCEPRTLLLLDDIAKLATEGEAGWFDASSGQEGGGSRWLSAQMQQVAVMALGNASAR